MEQSIFNTKHKFNNIHTHLDNINKKINLELEEDFKDENFVKQSKELGNLSKTIKSLRDEIMTIKKEEQEMQIEIKYEMDELVQKMKKIAEISSIQPIDPKLYQDLIDSLNSKKIKDNTNTINETDDVCHTIKLSDISSLNVSTKYDIKELNKIYKAIWTHFEIEGHKKPLLAKDMVSMGLKINDNGKGKLKILKALKLIKMKIDGSVILN